MSLKNKEKKKAKYEHIPVFENTKKEVDALKVHEKEPYDDVVKRLTKFYRENNGAQIMVSPHNNLGVGAQGVSTNKKNIGGINHGRK